MQPHLRDGQIVRVGPLRGRAPEIGEIVYYVNTHDATALHRMLARAPTRYGWRFLIGSDDGSALDLVRETSLIGRLSLEDAPGKLQAPPYWREWRARHKALCFVAGVCLRLLNIGEVVPVKWAWDTYRAAQTAPGNHE